MRARWLAVGLATLTLAACGPSHTGVVMNISGIATIPDAPSGGGWVLVVPDGGFGVDIWSGLYWVCCGFEADDVTALSVSGCDRADVVPGEIEVSTVEGAVFVGTR